jgi:hypothetical protein
MQTYQALLTSYRAQHPEKSYRNAQKAVSRSYQHQQPKEKECGIACDQGINWNAVDDNKKEKHDMPMVKKPVIYFDATNLDECWIGNLRLDVLKELQIDVAYPVPTSMRDEFCQWNDILIKPYQCRDLKFNHRLFPYLFWEGTCDENEKETLHSFNSNDPIHVLDPNQYIQYLEAVVNEFQWDPTWDADFITFWLPTMNRFRCCKVQVSLTRANEFSSLRVVSTNESKCNVLYERLHIAIEGAPEDTSASELPFVFPHLSMQQKGDNTLKIVEWGGCSWFNEIEN